MAHLLRRVAVVAILTVAPLAWPCWTAPPREPRAQPSHEVI